MLDVVIDFLFKIEFNGNQKSQNINNEKYFQLKKNKTYFFGTSHIKWQTIKSHKTILIEMIVESTNTGWPKRSKLLINSLV